MSPFLSIKVKIVVGYGDFFAFIEAALIVIYVDFSAVSAWYIILHSMLLLSESRGNYCFKNIKLLLLDSKYSPPSVSVGDILHIKIHGCSISVYKMVQYLHIIGTHPRVYYESSPDYLQCLMQCKFYANSWCMVNNHGEFKVCFLELSGIFFCKYYWTAVSWIHG